MTSITKEFNYPSARPPIQVIYYDGKSMQYMREVVESVTLGGDVARAYREIVINFTNSTKGKQRIFDIENGKEIRMLVGNVEIFRGIVFQTERNAKGAESITAYDGNIYLAKNKINAKYVKKTAAFIIKDLCKKYGIEVGGVYPTGYVIPKLIIRDETIYDIIVTVLTMTRKATGKRYILRSMKGKLELHEVRQSKDWLRYERGNNLIDVSVTESIEDTRTQVLYEGGDEDTPFRKVESNNVEKYGLMRHIEKDSEARLKQVPSLARTLIQELSKPSLEITITTLGNQSMISGTSVVVIDEVTGVRGTYFVHADKHEFSAGGVHLMDLTLTKTLDIPVKDYVPPEVKKPKEIKQVGDKVSGNNSVGNGVGKVPTKGAQGIVATANSYRGKLRYVFGGKNLATGGADCSGFTHAVFKKHGKNIPHGTSSQIRLGSSVRKGDAQAGDLVFFKNTYRKGVSHVGIVTRSGSCISLHNSGCTEHSYISGYWGKHYMSIRRV